MGDNLKEDIISQSNYEFVNIKMESDTEIKCETNDLSSCRIKTELQLKSEADQEYSTYSQEDIKFQLETEEIIKDSDSDSLSDCIENVEDESEAGALLIKPLKCDLCNYSTVRKSNLRQHMACHSTGKPYKCATCNFNTARLSSLKRHTLKHYKRDKPFECDQCNYACIQLGGLNLHKNRVHRQRTVFKCDLCNYETIYEKLYLSHQRSHAKKGAGNQFVCKTCFFWANSRNLLDQHIETHFSKKSYRCDQCEFRAVDINLLVEHMKIHSR